MPADPEFGSFQTAHQRLIRWAVGGTWEWIRTAVLVAADSSDDIGRTVSADSTVVRAHQHAAHALKRGSSVASSPADHAVGHSRGGLGVSAKCAMKELVPHQRRRIEEAYGLQFSDNCP